MLRLRRVAHLKGKKEGGRMAKIITRETAKKNAAQREPDGISHDQRPFLKKKPLT
jgi:hypothetical protein